MTESKILVRQTPNNTNQNGWQNLPAVSSMLIYPRELFARRNTQK